MNKIKAFTLLIAWSVIFAHSIIPHNHHNDEFKACHNLVHAVDLAGSSQDKTARLDSLPDKETVCHYSGFVFYQLNTDTIIISTGKTSFPAMIRITGSINDQNSLIFISDPHLGKSALRAPPLS